MFSLPVKPSTKVCVSCGSEVSPDWEFLASPVNGAYGWVGSSVCSHCGHSALHVSGEPSFTIPINSYLEEHFSSQTAQNTYFVRLLLRSSCSEVLGEHFLRQI